MAITGWSLTNFLQRSAAVWDGATPILINAWQFRAIDTGQGDSVGVGDASVSDEFRLRVNNSNVLAQDVDNGSVTSAGVGTEAPDEIWFSQQAARLSSSAEVWVDATNKATSGAIASTLSSNEVNIGRSLLGAPFDALWGLAEVSFWDVTGFSTTDRNNLAVALAGGANPLALNTQGGQPWGGTLIAYWRLLSTSDVADLTGNGHDLTIVGTLSNFATHPPVDAVPGEGATRTNLSLLGVG